MIVMISVEMYFLHKSIWLRPVDLCGLYVLAVAIVKIG